MKLFLVISLIIYTVATLFIFLYTFIQVHLLYAYLKGKKWQQQRIKTSEENGSGTMPFVSIQLPMYNEPFVCKRLIDTVCNFNYPPTKFEVQILDDSTDETIGIIDECVVFWKQKGIAITVVRRPVRTGYKAGALKYGLALIKGDFVAVFDADFIPESNFLLKTMPHFANANIGMVQTRWGHLNRDYSVLTKCQSFWLENHFKIEQTGRNSTGAFFNFNGTAGIWRKQAILDAGNWQEDTLTEDLDLSYRSQLKGWKFLYLEDVVAPAELPPTLNAFKSQQFRWVKGGAEVAKKMIPAILKSQQSAKVKWHAVSHLLNSGVYLMLAVSAVFSVPLLWVKQMMPSLSGVLSLGLVFNVNFIVLSITYYMANKDYFATKTFGLLRFIGWQQMYLSMSMAMSFHNARAVLLGYFGKRTAFVRTPKFNVENTGSLSFKRFEKNSLLAILFYGCLFVLFASAFVYGIAFQNFGFLLFHASLAFGLLLLIYMQVTDMLYIQTATITNVKVATAHNSMPPFAKPTA
jgi:cellulose synthase/poly-beta-1,6-N-acetylglucosamine synthase-like glycosyltransferase